MKVGTNIVTIFICISIITLIIGLYSFALISKGILEEETLNHLKATSKSRADYTESYLKMIQSRIVDFSSDGKIKDCMYDINNNIQDGCSSEELTEHLIKNKLPIFEESIEIFTLNTAGKIVASTSQENIGLNKKEEQYFINGERKLSIQESNYSKIDNQNFLIISSPINKETNNKETVGVIVGIISKESLNNILLDRTGLGKTGELLIAKKNENGDAVFITPRRFTTEISARDIIPKEELNVPITQALLQNEDVFINTIDYRGAKVLAATQYINEVEWGLVAKIDKKEAFDIHKEELMKNALIIILALTLFLTVIGFIVKPKMNRRINGEKRKK